MTTRLFALLQSAGDFGLITPSERKDFCDWFNKLGAAQTKLEKALKALNSIRCCDKNSERQPLRVAYLDELIAELGAQDT